MRTMSLAMVLAFGLTSCAGKKEDKAASDNASGTRLSQMKEEAPAAAMEADEVSLDGVAMGDDRARDQAEKKAKKRAGRGGLGKAATPADMPASEPPDADTGGSGGEGARARSWFPETFLFKPLVVTDAQGKAAVDVTVPDRLTSWRVLALAHSRQGSQAGAVTEFLGTLPAYVDPIVPPVLRVGDSIQIPIQLVNTTETELRTGLTTSVVGGELSAPPSSVTVPPRGSSVYYATLRATKPGTLKLSATLGGTDAVVRTARVDPVGKPIRVSNSGTLAAPRTIAISGPSGGETDRVRLEVFPGALAIVRAELSAASHRGGVAEDAFALLLAGRAPTLLTRLGETPDDKQRDALRSMTILTTQRVVRHARTLDVERATLLAEAALSHDQNPILENIGARAVSFLERKQLPDGTCGGETGWTVQRLLVATADCVRAAPSSRTMLVKATGAFERNARMINDPYTAAAILAADGVRDPELRKTLRELVSKAIEQTKDGSRRLVLPEGVVRADGRRPSVVEASAMAALALAGDADSEAIIADLGATILAGYSRGYGWGDGRANLVSLKALTELFDKPIPDGIRIELAMDGNVIASGSLDGDKRREVMVLEASDVGAAGEHTYTITATPAVPGLGFALEQVTWVPWPPMATDQGLEIAAPMPSDLAVGKKSTWRIDVAAPANDAFTIALSVPAGVQVERAALEALKSAGTLTGFQLTDEALTMTAAPLSPGAAFGVELPVIPTAAGAVWSGPASLTLGATTVDAPPTRWSVK